MTHACLSGRAADGSGLLDGDHRRLVNGLHDGSQAAAQVVGLVLRHPRRLFEDHRVGRTVQNSGEELAQPDL